MNIWCTKKGKSSTHLLIVWLKKNEIGMYEAGIEVGM